MSNNVTEEKITALFNQLKTKFSKDWLLNLEIYELALQNNFSIQKEILTHLLNLQKNIEFRKLIKNGLDLLKINNH